MSTPQRAESFLRELQGAVSSRRLYAPEHPRNVEILDRILDWRRSGLRRRNDHLRNDLLAAGVMRQCATMLSSR